ncbi:hypothetical protein N5B55_21415 [Ralstonia pickettii]|uniref:hypothetical protein n=1 Tax=Ralstonia pickettii TaxID=329 RepID=UPI0027153F61|nr:hypothetical protein [Ralstonia pickettii]WKZ87316.1 hypothetical protein N5B55_21415 [Ralstonia pickettii]
MISTGVAYLRPEHQGAEVRATITSAIEILKALRNPGDGETPLVNAVFVMKPVNGVGLTVTVSFK